MAERVLIPRAFPKATLVEIFDPARWSNAPIADVVREFTRIVVELAIDLPGEPARLHHPPVILGASRQG